jgi:adenosylcobinamide-GDP ribazoletransferase
VTAGEAVRFLTVVGGKGREGHAQPGPRALSWFPVVGAVLGSALGLAWWGLLQAFPAAVAAVIVVVADLGFTGMLHFDGLLDSADALLPVMERERRLVVMKDPNVGAFAVGAGAILLAARVVALATIRPQSWWAAGLILGGLWTVSRCVMVMAATRMRYARTAGLASAFLAEGNSKVGRARTAPLAAAVIGVGAGTAALCAWRLGAGLATVAAALVAALGVLVLASRRIGGFTGDVLGAAGVVSETVGLLVAAARW